MVDKKRGVKAKCANALKASKGCRAMHRMVFTPDGDQPQWAMAGCACSTCMSVPCLPCMKPDTTTPLEPMPMFQDTVCSVPILH
ncbi:hypothetical protein HaLaN_28215, partial [Haematococcus lacustris]